MFGQIEVGCSGGERNGMYVIKESPKRTSSAGRCRGQRIIDAEEHAGNDVVRMIW
jgi:hypothetical protein